MAPHLGDSHSSHLDIDLESADLVLRGLTGEELDPAVLRGQVVLSLTENTTLKEVQLAFSGSAKVTWRDSSSHHFDHPLFFHDFAFLNPNSAGQHASTSSSRSNAHSHTLKAGRHLFPFSLHVPGTLPASLRTYSGTCTIEYKLKALASRPGLSSDWRAKKVVRIMRGFGVDAVEYNQTLEIENTWPGKVMYAFTIPHKAYAAGDTIPVSVKFSPLAKGIKVTSLITTIREHTQIRTLTNSFGLSTIHSKNSQHSEARDATVVKYNFVSDAGHVSATPSGANSGAGTPVRIESSASLASMNRPITPGTPGFPMHGSGAPLNLNNNTEFPGFASRLRQRNSAELAGEGEAEIEEDDGQDTEIDVNIDVPLPVWTAPSHSVFPCFITHKIKWSAFIKWAERQLRIDQPLLTRKIRRNPDGHVSELRCALPIHILAAPLAEEARLASEGARNLLFGESGVLARSDVPQADLPSYQDHVLDRVANADTASYFSVSAGFTPTPWSHRGTPTGTPGIGSPMSSPPQSRPPSRPASPERAQSTGHGSHFSSSFGMSAFNRPQTNRHHSSGTLTPVMTPPGPDFDEEHPEDHRNWVDSELINSLSLDPVSPPGSHPNSRPGSRPSSRPGSRPPSRPGSPDHLTFGSSSDRVNPATVPLPQTPGSETPPTLSRSHTSGFFHNLHVPKPLRPLTSKSRNSSSGNLSSMGSLSPVESNNHPSASALSNALAAHAAKTRANQNQRAASAALETHTHPAMSNTGFHSNSSASPVATSPAQSHFPVGSPLNHLHASGSSPSPSHTPAFPGADANAPVADQEHHPPHGWTEQDLLNAVPSYEIAARGFLGGGVVPLSSVSGLPAYEDDANNGGHEQR
ncbi:hypothetical protein OIV83_001169 [Microbotryomycetes sp. JL201]|nr:hypothetical protein OIV83_001169 [Microbotryomycetes sp. JL201]